MQLGYETRAIDRGMQGCIQTNGLPIPPDQGSHFYELLPAGSQQSSHLPTEELLNSAAAIWGVDWLNFCQEKLPAEVLIMAREL